MHDCFNHYPTTVKTAKKEISIITYAEKLVRKANYYSEKGDLVKARRLLELSISKKPTAIALCNLATVLLQSHDPSAAYVRACYAIQLNPNFELGHSRKILALIGLNRFDEAQTWCKSCIEYFGPCAAAVYFLQDIPEKKADNKNDDYASHKYGLLKEEADELFRKQDYAKSIKIYNEALLWKNCPVILANRSAAHLKTQRPTNAYIDSFDALLHDPFYFKAIYRKAQSELNLYRKSEAMMTIKDALKIDAGNDSLIQFRKKAETQKCHSKFNKLIINCNVFETVSSCSQHYYCNNWVELSRIFIGCDTPIERLEIHNISMQDAMIFFYELNPICLTGEIILSNVDFTIGDCSCFANYFDEVFLPKAVYFYDVKGISAGELSVGLMKYSGLRTAYTFYIGNSLSRADLSLKLNFQKFFDYLTMQLTGKTRSACIHLNSLMMPLNDMIEHIFLNFACDSTKRAFTLWIFTPGYISTLEERMKESVLNSDELSLKIYSKSSVTHNSLWFGIDFLHTVSCHDRVYELVRSSKRKRTESS